eukprot:2496839-Pyramimonas_sp.AAC.2
MRSMRCASSLASSRGCCAPRGRRLLSVWLAILCREMAIRALHEPACARHIPIKGLRWVVGRGIFLTCVERVASGGLRGETFTARCAARACVRKRGIFLLRDCGGACVRERPPGERCEGEGVCPPNPRSGLGLVYGMERSAGCA